MPILRTDYSQEEAYYEQQCDPTWYVDSGATNHITHDLHNLNISIPYNGTDQVAVGNGQQLPIQSVGKSALLSNSSSIVSSNSSLRTKTFIEFHHNFCLVKDTQTQQVLMRGVLNKGLYQLESSSLLSNKAGKGIFLVSKAFTPSAPLGCTQFSANNVVVSNS